MSHPFNFARIAAEPLSAGHVYGGTIICDGPADAVATVHLTRGQASHDTAVAMFTAAPAMLAALQAIVADFGPDYDWPTITAARVAIAAATVAA